MTSIVQLLKSREIDISKPFFTNENKSLKLEDVLNRDFKHLENIKQGEVVALIGDFDEKTIADFLQLTERKVILAPLTKETFADHSYFFETAQVEWVVQNGTSRYLGKKHGHYLFEELRVRNNPGVILFSTGTTGRPKAILHDFSFFLQRYLTPRPALVTLNFLLFDHIGGINTMLHSMFNSGLVVSIQRRNVEEVLKTCTDFRVEVLPTTPTFLRMMLMSGLIPLKFPETLKIITYGTERMDEFTLVKLTQLLPNVEFRQTFGMSELGILRVKSESNDSLFMKIGGEGVTWRVVDGVLKIKSTTRMMGYLNAESPFDEDGWYDTKDLVEVKGEFLKVIGRTNNVVNVGGLKFVTTEVESVGLAFPGIADLSVSVRSNPITGEHVEMIIKAEDNSTFNIEKFKTFLNSKLPKHMIPRKISIGEIKVNHRFKKN
jgi:acyl-CoA synthetase (AMP-forming)/AMP-acid ligase II